MNLKNIESLRKAILKEEYGAEIQDSYITLCDRIVVVEKI